MGERDLGVATAAPAPPWRQRAALAGSLAALLAAVLALGPVASTPAGDTPALVTRLLATPLTAVAGARAPGILGMAMLALAAALACGALERRVGPQAPLLVALLVFGSGCWALVWTAGDALVPLALAVTAFWLAYEGGGAGEAPPEIYRPPETRWGATLRWLAVGLLLAELVPTTPLLAGLLVPAALVVPAERRRGLMPFLLGGFALGLAVELAVQGTDAVTGPLGVAGGTISLDPLLVGRNLAHLAVGRNVGLVPGFAPLLLLLALGRGSVARPALAIVGVGLPVLGALLLPFDYAAGWLNLSFVAVYGALWHLPGRSPRRWEWAAAVFLCGLATWPLWAPPGGAVGEGGAAVAGDWPRRLLPYEDTLRSLPSHGEGRLEPGNLRVRAVAGCRLLGEGGRFELDGDPAVIWVAAPSGVEMVALELGPGAPSTMEVAGATAGRTVFRPDGRVGFELRLDQPRARHRLWFGARPATVHLIEIRLPGRDAGHRLRFRLLAQP